MRSFIGALGVALICGGCGEATFTVTVDLTHSTTPTLDPFEVGVGLSKVRVIIDGSGPNDDVAAEIDLSGRSVSFDNYPPVDAASIRIVGFDSRGNIVAFGRQDGVEIIQDTQVSIPFRRNLAYVTHRANPAQDRPQSVIYQIDLATRALVGKVRLPGVSPTARTVTARGGRELLLTVEDQGRGSVVLLSAEDHSIRSIPLETTQELTLGVADSPIGVVVGGGRVTIVDLDAGTEVEAIGTRIGGRVLDGVISLDGRRAIVVLDVAPGLLNIDLVNQTFGTLNVLPEPGGVALGPDGRVAYVTSRTAPEVAAVDLNNGRASVLRGFVRGVGEAVYADELDAVLALDVVGSSGSGRVLGFVPLADAALGLENSVKTLNFPTGIAADGSGRRAVVVAAGTSTETAGLTVIESTASTLPQGASALYPTDPDDRFFDGPVDFGQRYQPSDVAVVYGR